MLHKQYTSASLHVTMKHLFLLVFAALLLTACVSNSIADIKNQDTVGERVAVRGTVESSIKIGDLSAYTLKDASGDTIAVSSDTLPADGTTVTARGVLIRDTLFGYYIKAD